MQQINPCIKLKYCCNFHVKKTQLKNQFTVRLNDYPHLRPLCSAFGARSLNLKLRVRLRTII